MEWPGNQFLKERTAMIDDRVTKLQTDVEMLKAHRSHCDELHEQHKEHKKRSDDAMNNLTESNMMLAKSITDMNVTLTKVVGIIESDKPDMLVLKNARIAWSVNKWVFAGVVTFAVGCLAIITFYEKIFI